MVRLLLAHGADPNILGGRWCTPLTASLKYRVCSTGCLSLLLDAGADPNGQVDHRDPTALICAAKRGDRDATTMLLLQNGVNVHHLNAFENVAHSLARRVDIHNFNLLLDKYPSINLRQEGSTGTPLHAAFDYTNNLTGGHDEIVRILFENGLTLSDGGPELEIDLRDHLASRRDWYIQNRLDVPAAIRRIVGSN